MNTPPPDDHDKDTEQYSHGSHETDQRLAQKASLREQRLAQKAAQREQQLAQKMAQIKQQEAQRQAKIEQHKAQHAIEHASHWANHSTSGWEDYAREHSPTHSYTPRGDAQRQALIEAAFHLIAEGGLEHFRTREVARRAGVNIATLHYYFTTKEDLIRAVVEYMSSEFAARRRASFAERQTTQAKPLDPLAELRAELDDTLYEIREYPELFHALTELSMRARRDPVIREMMQTLNDNWQNWLTGIIARGVREGVFRADLDPQIAARMLMDVTRGYTMDIMDSPQESFPIERIHEEIERWLTGYSNTTGRPRNLP